MNNSSGTIPGLPADPREVMRASCIRSGRCPELKRGDVVWLRDSGLWSKARVRRRIPGGCYMAEVITYPGTGSLRAVCANTYGGRT